MAKSFLNRKIIINLIRKGNPKHAFSQNRRAFPELGFKAD